jgi:ABC-type antimicrobial peptide transport system permease subunit
MLAKHVKAWDGYVQGYASVERSDGAIEEMRVRGMPTKGQIVWIATTEGRPFSDDDADEAILNAAFTPDRTPHVGEVVTVLRKGVRHPLRVVGIVTDGGLSTVLVPRGTAQRIFGLQGKYTGAYVRFGEQGTKDALVAEELVTSVEVRTQYSAAMTNYLAGFIIIVAPFIALGGTLAFFFLLSVLGFMLVERQTEYATLRSLGYAPAEIARIVLTEIALLAAVGIGVGIGAWAGTAWLLREPMAKAWFRVALDLRAHDFLTAAIPTLLFLIVASVLGTRAVLRQDLASVLRSRVFG